MDGLSSFITQLIIIFGLIDAVFLAAFIYSIAQSLKYRPAMDIKPRPLNASETAALRKAVTQARWTEIVKRFEQGSPDSMKVAIIEADKMVDDLLKNAGFKGEHMADRMEKLATADLPNLSKLWRAHRLRNQLVHSPDFKLSNFLADRTMNDYAAFLHDLNLID